MTERSTMVELTGAELDAVAAGAPNLLANAGLIAANVAIGNINVDVDVSRVLSDNRVRVGDVAVGVLSAISQ